MSDMREVINEARELQVIDAYRDYYSSSTVYTPYPKHPPLRNDVSEPLYCCDCGKKLNSYNEGPFCLAYSDRLRHNFATMKLNLGLMKEYFYTAKLWRHKRLW